MTFRDKIDNILKNNKIGLNTVYKLEIHVGASPSSINRYYKKNEYPGAGTLKKLWDGMNINRQWWESGNGDIFLQYKNEEDEILSHPLVQNQLKQIKLLEEHIELLKAELARLKGKQD